MDFDDLHKQLLDLMREGRITPSYGAEQMGESRQLVSSRLRDLQMAGHVDKIHTGLYELVDDPESDAGGSEPTPNPDPVEPSRTREHTAEAGADDAPTVTDADRERLREELDGSGDRLERRVEQVIAMYQHLAGEGEATKQEMLDAVDVEATGYASAESVWSNMVKGRETLRSLNGVETPDPGMSTWKYRPEKGVSPASNPGE